MVEFGVRLAGRKHKISTRFHQIADIVRDAAYWASKEELEIVMEAYVEKAIQVRHWRLNFLEDKIREMILDGSIMIDVGGKRVGQVNNLSLHDLGDVAFGRPSHITAETAMGMAGIINIERETELGGPIHNKGCIY